MKTLISIYKNEMFLLTLITSLFLWGLTMSFLAFKNESEVILIGKVDEGFKIITEKEDKGSLEAINFIRLFIALMLNFDEQSYIRYISEAGDLMSESLWNKKHTEFKELASFIEKNKVIQSSQILSITKLKTNQYEVEVKNSLFKNGNLTEESKTIIIFLTENERSMENPWSYNVLDIEIK